MTKKKETEVDPQPGIEDGLLAELLSEEECRQRIAAIIRRLPGERDRLNSALVALRAVKHKAWMAVTFLRDDMLDEKEAKLIVLEFKQRLEKKELKQPIKEDKEAMIEFEIGLLETEYKLAKLAVEASEKDYEMLNGQLIWYQSIRKNNGPVVPIEQSVNATYQSRGIAPGYSVEELKEAVNDGVLEASEATQHLIDNEPAFVPSFTLPTTASDLKPTPSEGPVMMQFTGALSYEQTAKAVEGTLAEQERAKVDFEGDPKARNILDMATATEAKQCREVGAAKGLNADAMCFSIMGCELGQMTSDAVYAFGEYLEAYTPVSEPETQPAGQETPTVTEFTNTLKELRKHVDPNTVNSIYGGPTFLKDVRTDEGPFSNPLVEYREPDGTPSNIPDDEPPF
jgi:hypothetical protein